MLSLRSILSGPNEPFYPDKMLRKLSMTNVLASAVFYCNTASQA